MGRVIKTGLACPVCGSSDAGTIYRNKDKETGDDIYVFKCFSGNHPLKPNGKSWAYKVEDIHNYQDEVHNKHFNKGVHATMSTIPAHQPPQVPLGLLDNGIFTDLKDESHPWGFRGISEDTCRFYGVTVREDTPHSRRPEKLAKAVSEGLGTSGNALIFPFYSSKKSTELLCQKVRTAVEKKGSFYKANENAITNSGFFGQQLFQSTSHPDIAITFGELDAMAVYQMIGMPTVSITNGDNDAPNQFKREYGWLARFRNIYLIPDNDDSCRAVLPAIGAIFPKKIKVVYLSKHKDPCDYLKNNDTALFRREWSSAEQFSPDKIISLKDLRNLLFEDPPKPIATYPWEGLNKLTGGIWPGELITVKAMPKVGKSTVLSSIVSHLSDTTDYNIGLIYLEETQRDIIFRFASFKLRKNLQRQDIQATVSRQELEEAMDELLSKDNIFIVDKTGPCSSDFLEEKITELVRAKSCQFIFFDHVSMAITDESNKDERLALDRLITTIKSLTVGIPDIETVEEEENGERVYKTVQVIRQPTIFMVTHVNDDGKTRGSRIAPQVSNLVLGLFRDKQAKDATSRNTLDIVIEESRRYGETGLACKLFYDVPTASFVEMAIDNPEETSDDTPVFDKTKTGGGYVYNPPIPANALVRGTA